jgi:hypothetical protein
LERQDCPPGIKRMDMLDVMAHLDPKAYIPEFDLRNATRMVCYDTWRKKPFRIGDWYGKKTY